MKNYCKKQIMPERLEVQFFEVALELFPDMKRSFDEFKQRLNYINLYQD